MKKLISILTLAVLMAPGVVFAFTGLATVYNPLTTHRKAVEIGDPGAFDFGYILETKEALTDFFGAKPFRPSGFETTLSSSLAEEGAETTLIVNSLTLPDSTTLDSDNYGDLLILTVGEGDSEEKIAVGALNETTKTFTITSRGLEYGRWASSTSNIVQHLPGERVYVSNDDHFLYQQYYALDSSEQTATGQTTFTATTTFTSDVIIPDYTSSDITYAANIGYVNNVATSGVADASASVAGKVEIGTSPGELGTIYGGTGAILSAPMAIFNQTPAGNTGVFAEADGKLNQGWIDLTENFSFSDISVASSTFTATSTFSNAPSITEGPTYNNDATRKSYVDSVGAMSFLTDEGPFTEITTSGTKTGTSSFATTRQANLIKFNLTLMTDMQNGANHTGIVTYSVIADLENNRIIQETLQSTASDNQIACSLFISGDFTQAQATWTSSASKDFSSNPFTLSGGNNVSTITSIIADSDSIDFGYEITDTGTDESCFYLSDLIVYN